MRRFCFVCNIKLCLFIKSLSSSISCLPDLKNEGIYQWVDGTKVTIKSNWEKNEPNNFDDDEDCVEVRIDGKWNDHNCLRVTGFVCERRLSNNKK